MPGWDVRRADRDFGLCQQVFRWDIIATMGLNARPPTRARAPAAIAGTLLLGASAVVLALAPLLLAPSYSPVSNTTSEAGAQGVEGAWAARTGFLLFGFGVIAVARTARRRWSRLATALHLTFAVSMICVAAWSTRPWEPRAGFDTTEDLLHSVGATTMGFAFAIGVAVVARSRWAHSDARRSGSRLLDVLAVAASIVLPVWMSVDGTVDGLIQRAMFLVAYVWYIREALIPRNVPPGAPAGIGRGLSAWVRVDDDNGSVPMSCGLRNDSRVRWPDPAAPPGPVSG